MKKIIIYLLACLPLVALNAKVEKQVIKLSCDLHCDGCCEKVMKNIAFEKGVKDLVCDLPSKTVTVTYDANKTDIDKLLAAFEKIGKPATVVTEEELQAQRKEAKKQVVGLNGDINNPKAIKDPKQQKAIEVKNEPKKMERLPKTQPKRNEATDADSGATPQ